MLRFFFVFLLGGAISSLIYCLITHWSLLSSQITPPTSNYLSRSDLIAILLGIFALLATVIVGFWQVKSSIDEGTKQQKIEWLNNIHGTVNGLRGLRDELEHNLKIYKDHILPNKNLYITGKSFHHSEYSTLTLEFNLEKSAFEYDRTLLNRIMYFYAFLEEANRIFRQARIPVITEQERSQFYTQIFSQHDANIDEWNKLIQDLSKYSNDYEPFASKASINSFQALSYGTKLVAAINPKNSKLILMNVGGESASEIKIICNFSELPESNKKFLLAFLSIRQPVEYLLDPPRYPDKNLFGQCEIVYKSEHSHGFKKINLDVKWDASAQHWLQLSDQEAIGQGVLRSSLGSIYSVSPYELQKPLPADLTAKLNGQGTGLIIQNNGGSPVSSLGVINDFGDIKGWKNVTFQYMLEPGEKIFLPMPTQQKEGNSFGGKILFQAEGDDQMSYKILSFIWDVKLERWISSH